MVLDSESALIFSHHILKTIIEDQAVGHESRTKPTRITRARLITFWKKTKHIETRILTCVIICGGGILGGLFSRYNETSGVVFKNDEIIKLHLIGNIIAESG